MKAGTVVLEIDRVVAGGYGLARTSDGVVLVRGALPGERVTGRPSYRAGVLRAHAIDILEPHPSRVSTPLPPGADLPLAYEDQLPIKEGLVREALSRIAKSEVAVEAIAASPRALGYRTAAQYVATSGGLGSRATDSDRVVLLESDPLVAEPIARAFDACVSRPLHGIEEIVFRASLHEGKAIAGIIGPVVRPAERLARTLQDAGIAGVVYGLPDERGRFRGRTRMLSGVDRMLEDFGGVSATVTVRSFAQVNPPSAGALFKEAAALAGTGARALDLYAGSGILGFHMAGAFEDVVAVEISPDAVRRGESDARRLGLKNVRFHRGDARAAAHYLPVDVVATDPPRAGMAEEVLQAIAASGPARIVYVSCEPSTFARDVARLASHGYRLSFVRPYDFYPFTHHVEVLGILDKS